MIVLLSMRPLVEGKRKDYGL